VGEVVKEGLPIEAMLSDMSAIMETAVSAPFLAAFALTNVIWLCSAGWLLVASDVFSQMWRISRVRAAAILAVVALVLVLVSGLVALAWAVGSRQ
jgi:high-affinity nickel permease